MVKWMTCCHKHFTRRGKKKVAKEKEEKNKKWFNLWTIYQHLQIGCKLRWARLQKPCKLITINFNFLIMYIVHFLCSWNMFRVWLFDVKFYIIQRFNILVKSIAFKPQIIYLSIYLLYTVKNFTFVLDQRIH
jgi:hypothetical protein